MSLPPGFSWSAEVAKLTALRVSAFGEPITYIPVGGSAVEIVGIFTDRVEEPTFAGFLTQIFIKNSDLLVSPALGDTVIHGTDSYQVTGIAGESTGGSRLSLKKV